MLTKIRLQNFRGFEDHTVPFKELVVIVGKNNSGKSTIVEALRLLSIVVSRYLNLTIAPAPEWTGVGRVNYGVRPSLRNMEIMFQGLFHRYQEPPAIITAEFSQGQAVILYISDENRVHAVIRDKNGKIIKTHQHALKAKLPSLSIMPQVAPVQKRETVLSEDYVKRTMSSSLAPLHFRNQISINMNLFRGFQRLVSETWPGVTVTEFIGADRYPDEQLYLQVRNEDFVGEVALMGHGLQMWLQTMWFLTLAKDSHTVILDEPDVYMHPDLQRRIIRYLKNRHRQTIITTHSVEILSEIQPENVLIIDRRKPQSGYASSVPAVQRLITYVGSVHNIHLTRLWHAHRFILIEGKDLKLLKEFHDILFPDNADAFDSIPSMPIGGWGGWQYAVGSAMVLQNAVGESITTYCLLDSDYHTKEEIDERYQQAAERKVQLHIWSKKEIENFLLDANVVQRVISHNAPKETRSPNAKEVEKIMKKIASEMRDDVLDATSTAILARNRKLAPGTANKLAREKIKKTEATSGNILELISGKMAISRLSDWSQSNFGVQLSAINIVREMRKSDVPIEIGNIISAIELGEEFLGI